ncbi:hypothetical protein [Deinococcus hopiensis]|uniref:hypothetical protein n=1 Tax=Deinococcus hopiensis TaxID=309885 RepID=UPI003CCB86B8
MTISDGQRKPAERFFRKAERKLRGAAKTLSCRKRGSSRSAKGRTKLARVHRRVAHQQNDFVRRTTAQLMGVLRVLHRRPGREGDGEHQAVQERSGCVLWGLPPPA